MTTPLKKSKQTRNSLRASHFAYLEATSLKSRFKLTLDNEMATPQTMTPKRFELTVYSRFKENMMTSAKKKRAINERLHRSVIKIEKEETKPLSCFIHEDINRTHESLVGRVEKILSSKQAKIQRLKEQLRTPEKQYSFTPRITSKGAKMKRNVDDLVHWKQERDQKVRSMHMSRLRNEDKKRDFKALGKSNLLSATKNEQKMFLEDLSGVLNETTFTNSSMKTNIKFTPRKPVNKQANEIKIFSSVLIPSIPLEVEAHQKLVMMPMTNSTTSKPKAKERTKQKSDQNLMQAPSSPSMDKSNFKYSVLEEKVNVIFSTQKNQNHQEFDESVSQLVAEKDASLKTKWLSQHKQILEKRRRKKAKI